MSSQIYLAVQTNWWATIALNISDLSRGLYKDKRGVCGLVVGPMVGIVLGQIVGTLLGYYLALLAGYVTPQEDNTVQGTWNCSDNPRVLYFN